MITVDYSDLEYLDLKDTLLKHGLVVIKNTIINKFQLEKISLSLGKNFKPNSFNITDYIQELSPDSYLGNYEWEWHNDRCYTETNCVGTVLYNVKNGSLSPTWFMDMANYPERFFVKYSKITSTFGHTSFLDSYLNQTSLENIKKQTITRSTVMTHPLTGVRVLYASPFNNKTTNVKDIIEYANDNCYKHEWEEQDLLVWDNFRMMHKRFKFNGHRVMWRTQFLIE